MVAVIDWVPVDVQVAPVIEPLPPEELLLDDEPPLGVADAAFELLAVPLTVFLIQK
jgi:hypothetical protein